MATPKVATSSYSAWLRTRRQPRRPRVPVQTGEIRIGSWVLAEQDGDLVVIHPDSGETTILMKGH